MVRHSHSALYWKSRCIGGTSSEEENVSPNVRKSPANSVVLNSALDYVKGSDTEEELPGSTGTLTPPWDHHRSPVRSRRLSPSEPNPATGAERYILSSPARSRTLASPTTSSPVLLESPSPASRPPPRQRPPARPPLREEPSERQEPRRSSPGRHISRGNRRVQASPYSRPRATRYPEQSAVDPRGAMRTSPTDAAPARDRASRQRRAFVPAQWPCQVAHLREQYNPSGIVFPYVQNFGDCGCNSPCRVNSCTNSLMHLYCNVNCCPYVGHCGNGLVESDKVYLARDAQTRGLAVVAAERIEAGVVLGQYLGELEHVSVDRSKRPRNTGYRLLMTQRPERPSHPICVAINAERLGSLMRFVNHSCQPSARFVEVSNGRRTTVVVVTTDVIREGEEILVDYGRDLWFVCRCQLSSCQHSEIQDQQDP